jgi:hypothetical protein
MLRFADYCFQSVTAERFFLGIGPFGKTIRCQDEQIARIEFGDPRRLRDQTRCESQWQSLGAQYINSVFRR